MQVLTARPGTLRNSIATSPPDAVTSAGMSSEKRVKSSGFSEAGLSSRRSRPGSLEVGFTKCILFGTHLPSSRPFAYTSNSFGLFKAKVTPSGFG